MAAKPKTEVSEISILEISQGEMQIAVVGTSPYYYNRMAMKAKQTLLMGGRRKTDADKAANLKHNPPEEYRDSVYKWLDDAHPTRLKIPAPSFKGAMGTAALVLPGTKKTEIGRLVWVTDPYVNFYGLPKLSMDVVRSADVAKTPDIRTRAKIDRWASIFTLRFVTPNLTAKGIINLVAASGIVAGVGDFRQEKGKGSFGQFRVADLDDPELLEIMATGGRRAQDEALEIVETYDDDSEELLIWYNAEIRRLGRESQMKPVKKTSRGKQAEMHGEA